jgi:hypothetical protein
MRDTRDITKYKSSRESGIYNGDIGMRPIKKIDEMSVSAYFTCESETPQPLTGTVG